MSQLLAFVFIALVLTLLGAVLGALVVLTVRAFRVGLGWGLAVLFVPFAPVFFAYTHWDTARGPALLGLGAIAGLFFVNAMSVVV